MRQSGARVCVRKRPEVAQKAGTVLRFLNSALPLTEVQNDALARVRSHQMAYSSSNRMRLLGRSSCSRCCSAGTVAAAAAAS